jgi:RNA polymerase sigma factor (sigma-70 family)
MWLVMKRLSPQKPEDARAEFSLAFTGNFADICKFVANRSSALDVEAIVSEAFLVAWKRWPNRPQRADEMRPWLFGIARNVMRSSGRHEQIRLRLEGPAIAHQDWLNDGLDRLESDLVLSSALAAISGDDREIILLVAWEDLDSSGLAIALGISKTAARVRLHRARKRLAAEVANSEVAQPEVAKSEVAKSEVAQPEVAKTKVAKPEVAKTKVAKPEVAKTEVVASEVTKSTLHLTEISPVVARSNSVSINNALNAPPSTSGKNPERTNHEIS